MKIVLFFSRSPYKSLLGIGWLLFCSLASADTYSLDAISQRLRAADLVANVRIESKKTVTHPTYFLATMLKARILAPPHIHNHPEGAPRVNESIEIELPGGESTLRGVRYSGYPQLRTGVDYRIHLSFQGTSVSSDSKDAPTKFYTLVGLAAGVSRLNPNQAFSRNRTDGSNGEGVGPQLYWDKSFFPIPYFVAARSFRNHSDFLPAIDEAFQSWRSAKGVALEFVPLGCTEATLVQNDGINSVIFVQSGWPFDADAIAINRSFYVAGGEPRAGLILDSDILLNGQNHGFSTTNEAGKHDVQNIVTHEVGHFIGLGHEVDPQDSQAAMFPFANPNEFMKRTLAGSDIAGVTSIYAGSQNNFPRVVATTTCSIPNENTGCLSVPAAADPSPRWWPSVWILWLSGLLLVGRALIQRA